MTYYYFEIKRKLKQQKGTKINEYRVERNTASLYDLKSKFNMDV